MDGSGGHGSSLSGQHQYGVSNYTPQRRVQFWNDDVRGNIFPKFRAQLKNSLIVIDIQVYTGNVPFSARRFYGSVVLDVMRGIRPPRPSLESCPNLKDELWDVIQSCWAQDPCQRRECPISW